MFVIMCSSITKKGINEYLCYYELYLNVTKGIQRKLSVGCHIQVLMHSSIAKNILTRLY